MNPESIGAAIRLARQQQHLTQTEFAERIEVSRRWLWCAERGGDGMDLDLVLRACRAVGIEVRGLLPDGVVVWPQHAPCLRLGPLG